MNERYSLLNHKINNWYANKQQDINILKSLYSQANLQENNLVDRSEDIKKNTMFSGLSDKELIAKFEKEYFNKYSDRELKHLFQEAHNRFIKSSGLDVTRNVAVIKNSQQPGMGGYVSFSDDLLFMNKYLIEKGKATQSGSIINENSIGKVYLDVLFHESKHVIQYEDAIDFALGNKQEPDRAFAGALMMMNNTNFYIADQKKDRNYVNDWRNKYNYHFYEHEANYAAIKRVEQFYDEDKKNTLDYAQFQTLYMDASLHFRPDPKNPNNINEKTCAKRVQDIEDYVKSQMDYFRNGTADCELKNRVLSVMEQYVKVDKNGHSPLRDRLNKEVKELCDYSVNAQNTIAKYEEASFRRNGKRINLVPEQQEELFEIIM